MLFKSLIFNFSLCLIFYLIISCFAKQLKLIDYPSSEKTHKNPTPAIGGVIFLLLYISVFFQYFIFDQLDYFHGKLVLASLLIFLIGYYDDLQDNNPYIKTLLFITIIFIFLFFNQEILIKKIIISFSEKTYVLNHFFSYMFTILCFWLLMNSFNLADGFNGVALSLAIIYFMSLFALFHLSKLDQFFLINITFFLILLLIFNFFGKLFLGNNGSYLISFILSVYLIKFYNTSISVEKIFTDKIFLVLMIPGFDMLRLFLERIKMKKNPLKRDKNHLHHNFAKIVPEKYVFLLYSLIVVIPIILDQIFNNVTIQLIIISFLVYLFLIYKLRRIN